MSNPNPFVSDAEIEDLLKEEEYGETLDEALDTFVAKYLLENCGEQYSQRRRSYDQSYVICPPSTPWWKRLFYRYRRVEHPYDGREDYLYSALAWFDFCAKTTMYYELSRGASIAFGFTPDRQYGDLRKRVPLDVWGDDMSSKGIDWKNSSVSNNGLSFVGIKIVNFRNELLSDEEQEALNERALIKHERKSGRPPMETAITRVYFKMKAEKRINYRRSFPKNCPDLRKECHLMFPDVFKKKTSPGDYTIDIHIGKDFRAEEERIKQQSQ